ncbi:hypothetical protein [Acinetobacter radioresistens]|uniref:hypothetical protein n=1 Tax=Acinetobacter radioresistens TaxID=40216 RepID=UPI00200358E1|nr:hypothetical protein [Acinetobacter radioresistens]MCK4108884.1 hypothetical protein [Acinetobacter radioresistens]
MNYLRKPRLEIQDSYQKNPTRDERKYPDDFRVDSLLHAISRGKFKYYVCGGYIRSRRLNMDPQRVAKLHGLNLDECLFEVKDQRIDDAVTSYGLERITPNTKIKKVEQPTSPVCHVVFNTQIKRELS